MHRNLTIGITVVVIAILVGLFIVSKYRQSRQLPNGTMTQDQTTPTPQVSGESINGRPQVTIKTTKGDIVIELRPDVAPKTVANFLTKFSNGHCDGLTWHRVEDWVVQGCDPAGNGTGGNSTLPTETSSENFSIGAVGVARQAFPKEISNDSQFFIVKKDSSFLNGEYTYFGHVVSGMDIVNNLTIGDEFVSTTILSK